MGRYDAAIEECKRAIEVDPSFGNPYNDIGAYLIELERLDEAIPWLQRAISAPRYCCYFYAHTNLARVYLQKGLREKARKALRQALDVNPEYEPARNSCGGSNKRAAISAETPGPPSEGRRSPRPRASRRGLSRPGTRRGHRPSSGEAGPPSAGFPPDPRKPALRVPRRGRFPVRSWCGRRTLGIVSRFMRRGPRGGRATRGAGQRSPEGCRPESEGRPGVSPRVRDDGQRARVGMDRVWPTGRGR